MNVIASKIRNVSNRTKLYSTKKMALTSLLTTIFYWINETMNVSNEVWMWVHWKYVMSQIIKKLYQFGTNNWTYLAVLKKCSIESTEKLMWVMKYEGECIKNMECVELYGMFIKLKLINELTLLSPTVFDWTKETMSMSDDLPLTSNVDKSKEGMT